MRWIAWRAGHGISLATPLNRERAAVSMMTGFGPLVRLDV